MLKNRIERLKGNSGSILFIVLLVMTVLIVLASAAYYTVNANRSELVTEYTDTQTYTSATAISKMVSSALQGETTDATKNSFTDLQDLVSNLTNEGDFVWQRKLPPSTGCSRNTPSSTYDDRGANAHIRLKQRSLQRKEVKTTEILDSTIVRFPRLSALTDFSHGAGLDSGEVIWGVSESHRTFISITPIPISNRLWSKTAFYADLSARKRFVVVLLCTRPVSTPLTWTVGKQILSG